MSNTSPRVKRTARAVLIGSTAAVMALTLAAGTAFAGKPTGGGTSGSSTLALVVVDDANGNGQPNWADTITFNVSSSATNSIQVSLACYQGSTRVLHANAAWYDGNPFAYMQMMKLQSGAWTGGAADCTAKSYYSSGKRTVTLKTLAFSVGA